MSIINLFIAIVANAKHFYLFFNEKKSAYLYISFFIQFEKNSAWLLSCD